MSEQIARFKPGENVPGFATAQVNGGRFVKIAADKTDRGDYAIAHCGAGEAAFGVAEVDSAPATFPAHATERVVNVVRRGAIARVEIGAGGLRAGEAVKSDTDGRAVLHAGSGTIVGYACNTVEARDIGEIDLV